MRDVSTLPSYEEIRTWAINNKFKFVCGMFGNRSGGCLLTALHMMANPEAESVGGVFAIDWAIEQFGDDNCLNLWTAFDCSRLEKTKDPDNPFCIYGFNARTLLKPSDPILV